MRSVTAWARRLRVGSAYLSSTVTGKRVVPQSLVWPSQWFLVVAVVAVRSYSSREARNDRGSEPHIAVVFQGVDAAENGRGWERCRNRSGKLRRARSI